LGPVAFGTFGAKEHTIDIDDFIAGESSSIPAAIVKNILTHELGEALKGQIGGMPYETTPNKGTGGAHEKGGVARENAGLMSDSSPWRRGGDLSGNHYSTPGGKKGTISIVQELNGPIQLQWIESSK
jgi:hypothetical protein